MIFRKKYNHITYRIEIQELYTERKKTDKYIFFLYHKIFAFEIFDKKL